MIEHECTQIFHQLRTDGGTDLVCEMGVCHGTERLGEIVAAPPPRRSSYTSQRVGDLEMKVQALKGMIIELLVADPIDHEGLDTCTHCAGVIDEHDDDCPWLAASEAAKAF